MAKITRRFSGDLTIKLGANEVFKIRSTRGQDLFKVTMSADESEVAVESIPITEHDVGYDLGDTGWTP